MTYKINTKAEFDTFVVQNWNEINSFLDTMTQGLELPLYTSVDIRESLKSYAPIDNNLYPAGFNNICMLDLNLTAEKIKSFIISYNKEAKRIGIISESHTKNKFYLNHLAQLSHLVKAGGFEVKVISLDDSLFVDGPQLELESQDGSLVTIYKAQEDRSKIKVNNESLDFIIINNDQSQPIDIDWAQVSTPIHPSPFMGWDKRQKTTHFEIYKEQADKFCEHFSIDPTLIQAKFISIKDLDFLAKEGLDKLGDAVDEIKAQISEEQKVFIKASQGTYGMGIMVVNSGDEVRNMNRKTRNKMDVGKNKIKFTSALIQEGIETVLTHDGNPAEITIYLIGGKSVGGFLRTNPDRDSTGNLNSRGVIYQKFCISEIHEGHDHKAKEAVYSVIARLSTIAGAYEIKEMTRKQL